VRVIYGCCVAETSPCESADCDQTCVLTHTDNTASAAYRCMCQTGFQPSTANLSQCVSTSLEAGIPPVQFPGSILVTSSRRHIRHERDPRQDATRMSCVSGDIPILLATHLLGRLAVCCDAVLPDCPCVVSFSKVHEHDTHNLLQSSILVPSSSDTSDAPNFLVSC